MSNLFKDHKNHPVCREQAVTDVIEAIALQESALACIINAECEKFEKIIDDSHCVEELLKINESVKSTLEVIEKIDCTLLEELKELDCEICDQKKRFNED